jgi:hypothetical protein
VATRVLGHRCIVPSRDRTDELAVVDLAEPFSRHASHPVARSGGTRYAGPDEAREAMRLASGPKMKR